MKKLYYSALFNNENIEKKIIEKLDIFYNNVEKDKENSEKLINPKDLIPILALYKDKSWSINIIEKLLASIETEEGNFELLDELIYYLTYFDDGIKYLEELNEKVTNLKLKLEIITSIAEKDRERALPYMKEFVESDDLGKISVGIFLIKDFKAKELIKELKSVMKRPMLDDIKYQVLFTLGALEDESILPVILKGATNKNDMQLSYLDALSGYDNDLVKTSLKKIATKKFGDKIIKLRAAQLLYRFDSEISDTIFSKFIKSKKLDIQGYVISILSELKNSKFSGEINDIFSADNHFHKANSIVYFRRIKYKSKISEIKNLINHPKFDLRDEASRFIASLEDNEDNLIDYYNNLEEQKEKLIFLKRIINNRLRQK